MRQSSNISSYVADDRIPSFSLLAKTETRSAFFHNEGADAAVFQFLRPGTGNDDINVCIVGIGYKYLGPIEYVVITVQNGCSSGTAGVTAG